MSTAAKFDAIYAGRPDPWGIANYSRRDRAMTKLMSPLVRGKRLLELGCGEGHSASTVFSGAKWIVGIDISAIAIERTPRLPNAEFRIGDQRTESLSSYDVVVAIECLNYLPSIERNQFFERLAKEHRGIFIMMTSVSGAAYFTHQEVIDLISRHGLILLNSKNVYVGRQPSAGIIPAALSRIPVVCDWLADFSKYFVCHRAYIIDCRPTI